LRVHCDGESPTSDRAQRTEKNSGSSSEGGGKKNPHRGEVKAFPLREVRKAIRGEGVRDGKRGSLVGASGKPVSTGLKRKVLKKKVPL